MESKSDLLDKILYTTKNSGIKHHRIVYITPEIRDYIKEVINEGNTVQIKGLGTFLPSPQEDGSVKPIFIPAKELYTPDCSNDKHSSNTDESGTDNPVKRWEQKHPGKPV